MSIVKASTIAIRTITIVLCIVISVANCNAQIKNGKKRIRQAYSQWMNVDYRNCLKTDMPCECEKSNEFFLISIDTNNQFVVLYEGRANYEHASYNYKRISGGRLQVYDMRYAPTLLKDTIVNIGEISLKKDTLFFSETSGKLTRFIHYKTDEDRGFYKEHVQLLNHALEKRGYDDLYTLLKSDSLKCWCNWELGAVNVVFDFKTNWILEKSSNVLYIYEWINPPRDKTLDVNIKKKVVYKIMW